MRITEVLFEKRYSGEYTSLPISDIPVQFLVPENRIMIHVDEGQNMENGWEEGKTTIQITVHREQTEEEERLYKEQVSKIIAKSRDERYEKYLKLKKEFEQ